MIMDVNFLDKPLQSKDDVTRSQMLTETQGEEKFLSVFSSIRDIDSWHMYEEFVSEDEDNSGSLDDMAYVGGNGIDIAYAKTAIEEPNIILSGGLLEQVTVPASIMPVGSNEIRADINLDQQMAQKASSSDLILSKQQISLKVFDTKIAPKLTSKLLMGDLERQKPTAKESEIVIGALDILTEKDKAVADKSLVLEGLQDVQQAEKLFQAKVNTSNSLNNDNFRPQMQAEILINDRMNANDQVSVKEQISNIEKMSVKEHISVKEHMSAAKTMVINTDSAQLTTRPLIENMANKQQLSVEEGIRQTPSQKQSISELTLPEQADFATENKFTFAKEDKLNIKEGSAGFTLVKTAPVEQTQILEQSNPVNNEPEAFSQISSKISHILTSKSDTSFKMKLCPEGLGEITVTLNCQENKISLDILTDNISTQKLLEGQADQLKSALLTRNYEVSGLNVSAQADSSSGMGNTNSFFQKHPNGEEYGQKDRQPAYELSDDFSSNDEEMLPITWLEQNNHFGSMNILV